MMDSGATQDRIPTARSLEIPKRWPLVNTLTSRNQLFNKDARLINAYAEKDPITGEHQIEKRPGFALTPSIVGAGVGKGIFTYPYIQTAGPLAFLGTNYLTIYVSGNNAYVAITDATGFLHPPASVGAVNFWSGTKFQFLGIPSTVAGSGTPTVLFSGNNAQAVGASSAYAYNTTAGLVVLAGGGATGFPVNNVSGFVYLNGFCYVMDYTGTIWETTVQNVVLGAGSWSATAFISAASDADIAVQLARQLIYVVAIKTWSTQIFYDASNTTGSSLSPLPGALYNFGCVSSDTFQDLDGVLFWATQSKGGTNRIVMLDNLEETFISSPAVERQLDLASASTSVFYSLAYQHAGHRWYLITNLTTNVTMCYDIGEKLWYLWTDYLGNYYPVIARAIAPPGGEWHQMGANGNVYKLDGDYVYPNDFGNVVPVDIYTPNFDAGVDRIKQLSQMRFNADQAAGSKLWVRFSENDYGTWTNFRQVDLSKTRPILSDEGSFYHRAYHFRHYANTGLRIRSVDLQMDLGTL